MEILKQNDWSKINEAYQIFINTGKILPNTVRPEIERSWRRCQSINPWSPRPTAISDDEYEKIFRENVELVEVATPIMQYMYATNTQNFEDNLIHLVEKSGVVLQFVTRVCTYPIPLKKRVSETIIGTTNSGLALVEQKAVEVGGYEMYMVSYQPNYGGAAPIFNKEHQLVGAVSLYNNFGKIPEQPLEFVEAAARLISDLLGNSSIARKSSVEANNYFTQMINQSTDYILIVDKIGRIVNLNTKCQELLGLCREAILGRACCEFGVKLDELISDAAYVNKDYFSIKTHDQQTFTCLLQNNKTIKWLNGQKHTLLLFSLVGLPKMRAKIISSRDSVDSFDTLVGRSAAHFKLINMGRRAARVPASVLIDGESGTGKDVLARAVHNASPRAAKPFLAVDCGSIPKEILASELFGYEEGAFTGGKKGGQIGKFEAADGGTLFLDEIGEMPIEMQVSLLRFLEDRTITRVGSHQAKKVDVRVISATNRNLTQRITEGLFREDLYYRLKVIHITLPPLRERADDILPLADFYVEYYAKIYGIVGIALTQQSRNLLRQYNWPGNIRELANVIENAMAFSDGDELTPDLLPLEILEYQPQLFKVNSVKKEQSEREIIASALRSAKGNVSHAAKSIGVSRNTFYRKIDKYGLHCEK